jgi:hypothetical protein
VRTTVACVLVPSAIWLASVTIGPAHAAQCNAFLQLRDDAQKKASAVRTAVEHKDNHKEICTLVQRYYAAEITVVNFLEENKTRCGIPDEAIKIAISNHALTDKFRAAACNDVFPLERLEDALGAQSTSPTSDSGDVLAFKPPTTPDHKSSITRVSLKKDGGVFVVPVEINSTIKLDFTIDSGAAHVSVPADVFSTLRRAGHQRIGYCWNNDARFC